ncbi:MAG: MmcQ/YjbR family DNA-binding protein [Acidobacteriota bacterium]
MSEREPTSEDPRLKRLSKVCLALPNTERALQGSHASFTVRLSKTNTKVFAYFLNNHHGDGIVSVACRVGLGDNQALVEAQPDRFHLPAYIAHRGWVGLRLDADKDVGKVDWAEVTELVQGSYQLAGASKAKGKT